MAKSKKDKSYILPNDFGILKRYIVNHRLELTEKIVSSIETAIQDKLPIIEIFKFSGSDYIITLSSAQFKENLDHILKYYQSSRQYKMVNRVKSLIDKL